VRVPVKGKSDVVCAKIPMAKAGFFGKLLTCGKNRIKLTVSVAWAMPGICNC
jgi:hypothetical protein